jgi:hypothetical protein
MKKRHIFYSLIFLLILFFSCQSQLTLNELLRFGVDADKFFVDEVTLPQPRKEWTIMIYMAADNNLSVNSINDINEILSIGGSTSLVNVVVCWDKAADLYEDLHGYYYIGRTKSILLKEFASLDMGDPKTATATIASDGIDGFNDFVVRNFKANHYMFIFWDHGAGADRSSSAPSNIMKSVCDDNPSGTALDEVEQKQIIYDLSTKIGKKVDIVGYDACLMGMAEVIYQLRDCADYVIASEDDVPGPGYDYTFINEARTNFNLSSYDLAMAVLNYYKNIYSTTSYITLSIIDMAYIGNTSGQFAYLLNDFAATAMLYGSQSIYKAFLTSYPFPYVNKFPYNLPARSYDLYDFMVRVKDSSSIDANIKPKAQAILDLMDSGNLIKAERHGFLHTTVTARGISILIAAPSTAYINNHDLCGGAGGGNTSWDEFLTWLAF